MSGQKNHELPSSEPADKLMQHKSNRARSRRRLWWGLALISAGLVSTTAGALLAISFASKPLMQSQLAQKQAGVFNGASISGTGLSFAQLTHPVNVLILGIDNDDNFDRPQLSTKSTSAQALSSCSDTMLLVRFLPDTHQINVLSIPRDTLVHLPGISIAKIDWANLVGGAALAAQTVSQQIGGEVPIDRYVRLSRNGFIQLVDALGGVEVTIPKRMDYVDETQHLNIHFLPGRQKLNGRHLEEYVRFRHDRLGDIGRVQRQQEVLKAIMQTLLQPTTLAKLPQILRVAQENIDTDLSIQEILALVQVTLTTDREQNNFLMLPGRFSRPGEYTRSYWIEDRQAAAPMLARYFNASSNPGLSEAASAEAPSHLRVAVVNATDRPGAGKRTVAFLKKRGFNHVYITDHEVETSAESALKTQIIAQHGNPEDASAVQSALGLGHVQVTATGDVWSDVTIVIGADFPTQFKQ
ncbi:MAG: LCP family protein [Chroococcidiopsidaceae cyanobacterium CP_BM_ER_R8_30]|nr:LCP family protein [Chroococcidiopsidaceae cyanobacterium CP_BM_ER_R8_30]